VTTKADLITAEELAELDRTPFLDHNGQPGRCSICQTELPTEGDFARHFTVPDPNYKNLGYCPNRDFRP